MVFEIKLITKLKSFKSLQIFNQCIQNKSKKFPPKFDKILGCYKLPPLKEISSLRLERLERKLCFGLPRWLPPLKETFVGSLSPWVQSENTLVLTWHWVIL
jgi:hypothetical protein